MNKRHDMQYDLNLITTAKSKLKSRDNYVTLVVIVVLSIVLSFFINLGASKMMTSNKMFTSTTFGPAKIQSYGASNKVVAVNNYTKNFNSYKKLFSQAMLEPNSITVRKAIEAVRSMESISDASHVSFNFNQHTL